MIAVNGYFDGNVIRTLEKINARKNQRVIITLLDEEIQADIKEKKISAAGSLVKYANPNLIPMEDGAWERAYIVCRNHIGFCGLSVNRI